MDDDRVFEHASSGRTLRSLQPSFCPGHGYTRGQEGQGNPAPPLGTASTPMPSPAATDGAGRGQRPSSRALRHTFGTLWEGDELILQQILGHRKLEMVQRYRRFRIGRAVAQHAVHSPLAQLSLW